MKCYRVKLEFVEAHKNLKPVQRLKLGLGPMPADADNKITSAARMKTVYMGPIS